MLKNATAKSEKHFDSRVQLLEQNILKNDLPSNYYDIVICAFGLKTFDIKQLQVLATETKRILKTGGQFSFVEVSKPTNKILNQFYCFYLRQIIPILGKVLLGNPTEYKMLWRYTDKFDANSAEKIFNNQGLTTKSNSYFYGCSTGFSGHK
jgi:ubiquinone/menaquinone biosynthesis C-methylase UbiE